MFLDTLPNHEQDSTGVRDSRGKDEISVMKPSTRLRVLKVKASGRSHLACERCRAHKTSEQPKCKHCHKNNSECYYPQKDRIVSVSERELNTLQEKVDALEEEILSLKEIKKIPLRNDLLKSPNENSTETVLGNTLFQATTTTDSSVHSILDINFDDELDAFPSDPLRHYFENQDINDNSKLFGMLHLPNKQQTIFLVQKAIAAIGLEYYLFELDSIFTEIEEAYSCTFKAKNPSWVCYLLITLAIGQQYSSYTRLTSSAPGIEYYNQAIQIFPRMFERPSTRFIQTLLLCAFYQQGLNRSNTASSFYGLAIRSAMGLGIHRKSTLFALEERERRRRLWWTCYVMDCIWCAKLGQPIHAQKNDISVEIFELCSVNDGFMTRMLRLNSELSIIIEGIIQTIYKPNSVKRVADVLNCLEELSQFRQNLPEDLKEIIISIENRTSANLFLRLNQIVIITVRPLILSIVSGKFVAQSPVIVEALKKCVSAATSNISIIFELRKLDMFTYFGFWDARYLFTALLILYMNGEKYTKTIEQGRELNRQMSKTGNFAAIENELRFEELDKIYHEKNVDSLQPSDETPIDVIRDEESLGHIQNEVFDENPKGSDRDFTGLFSSLSNDLPPDVYRSLSNSFKNWDNFGLY